MPIIYAGMATESTCQAVYVSHSNVSEEGTLIFPGPGDPLFEATLRASILTPSWHCVYCGQSNAAEREGCRGCGSPKPRTA